MCQNLKGKKIVVAGASGLLGSTLVKKLIELGSEVIAIDLCKLSTEKKLNELGVNDNSLLSFHSVNLTVSEEVKSFWKSQKSIDGAVNCSYPRNRSYGTHFFDVTLESFNENISMHLGSSFLFTQQCAAYFDKYQAPFSLVNISSIYGVVAPEFSIYKNTSMTMPVEYAAIKSALLHLNKYVVKYVKNSNFRINSVSPGGIFDHQPTEFLDAYKEKTHGQGMLNISDVIGSIVYLLSEESKFVTGQNIIIDDGFSL